MDQLTIFALSLATGLGLGSGAATVYWRYRLWKTNYLWSLQLHVLVRNTLAALLNGQVSDDGVIRLPGAEPVEENKDKSN